MNVISEREGRTHHRLVFWRHHSVEEKLKFYITSFSFCLCNSACSLQSLDQVGLRKWGLRILGTGAYLTHPCPALCNCPSPCKPANLLNHSCPCIKNSVTPLFRARRPGVINLSSPTLWVWCLSWLLQHFQRPQRDSNHAGPLSRQTGGLWRNREMNEEVHQLTVFQVLFRTRVLILRMT